MPDNRRANSAGNVTDHKSAKPSAFVRGTDVFFIMTGIYAQIYLLVNALLTGDANHVNL